MGTVGIASGAALCGCGSLMSAGGAILPRRKVPQVHGFNVPPAGPPEA